MLISPPPQHHHFPLLHIIAFLFLFVLTTAPRKCQCQEQPSSSSSGRIRIIYDRKGSPTQQEIIYKPQSKHEFIANGHSYRIKFGGDEEVAKQFAEKLRQRDTNYQALVVHAKPGGVLAADGKTGKFAQQMLHANQIKSVADLAQLIDHAYQTVRDNGGGINVGHGSNLGSEHYRIRRTYPVAQGNDKLYAVEVGRSVRNGAYNNQWSIYRRLKQRWLAWRGGYPAYEGAPKRAKVRLQRERTPADVFGGGYGYRKYNQQQQNGNWMARKLGAIRQLFKRN